MLFVMTKKTRQNILFKSTNMAAMTSYAQGKRHGLHVGCHDKRNQNQIIC